MIGTEISLPFNPQAPIANIDARMFNNQEPWNSLEEFLTAVPMGSRKAYMTINILGVEYSLNPDRVTAKIKTNEAIVTYASMTALLAAAPTSAEFTYQTLDNMKTYKYNGVGGYALISDGLALGETSETAYAGDKGNNLLSIVGRFVKDYNPDYNFKGFCIADQAPPSAAANDCYYFTGDVTSTVFGIIGVTTGSFLVFSTVWSFVIIPSFLKTDSDGSLRSLTDENFNRIKIVKGGVFDGIGTNTTGAFKIKLPSFAAGARNVVFDVVIMDNYGVIKLTIAGMSGIDAWIYTKVAVSSDHPYNPCPVIRYGKDADGWCVWIGELAYSYWTYPKVWIENVSVVSGNYHWAEGWGISLVAAFDTVSVMYNPPMPMSSINPTFTGTINQGTLNFPVWAGGTYLGYHAGQKAVGNGTYNTFVGYEAGAEVTSGYNNTFLGLQSGAACTTGFSNSGHGIQTLQYLTTGSFNSAMCIHALLLLIDGVANNAIGAGAMEYLLHGTGNNAFGMYAGRDVQGDNNLFLGHHSGMKETGSGKIYIANKEIPFIYGDFEAMKLSLSDKRASSDPTVLAAELLPSAIFQLDSVTKGLACPRMTTTQRNAIVTPDEGIEIYNLTSHAKEYFNGTIWKTITTV